ncbi:MAG: hypothetical protein L6Q71_12050, partial [Planctomycetes bacterium]|nr:hypothetical protein [Planctomycetota bacterium]
TELTVSLLALMAPALFAEYRLLPSRLDLGVLNTPGIIRETVRVEGAKRDDQLKVNTRRGVGVFAAPCLPDSKGKMGFDVLINPLQLEPGKYEDTIDVTINEIDAGQFIVSFEVTSAASAELLRSLVVYAKEGESAGLKALSQALGAGGASAYPDMLYQVDLRFVHEDRYKTEYDQLIADIRAAGGQVEKALPAVFIGRRLLGEGPYNADRILGLALQGQNFANPKPVVEIITASPPLQIYDTYVKKIKPIPSPVVFLARQVAAQDLGGKEAQLNHFKAQGTDNWSGSLADLEAALRKIMAEYAQPAGVMRSPDGLTSEGTSVVTSGGSPVITETSSIQSGNSGQTSTLFIVVAIALGVIVAALFVVVRRQQVVLNDVSRRLESK